MSFTETVGPFDGSPWSQDQWYRYAPSWMRSGVSGTPPLSTSAGGLGITFSGLTPTLALGRAWVHGAGYELAGGSKTLPPVAANTNASLARIDRLVLRRDLAAKTLAPTMIVGTPASTPVPPALTQVETGIWDVQLYSFTVPPNSGTNITNVVDERTWLPDPAQPIYGKAWRVGGFSGPISTGTAPTVLFDTARVSGGVVFVNANTPLVAASTYLQVPLDGIYSLRSRAYASGGGTPCDVGWGVNRTRAGVADATVMATGFTKEDGQDRDPYLVDSLPLKAGDKLWVTITTTVTGTNYWGVSEVAGVMLSAQFEGPLNGATPV